MFFLFLCVIVIASVIFIVENSKSPVSTEQTYLLYAVVGVAILLACFKAGILSLILFYLWKKGYIVKWYNAYK